MICFLGYTLLYAGDDAAGHQNDSTLVKHYKVNFAVPDIPAFKSLDIYPDRLLRPSTPEAFSTAAAQFLDGNRIVLPRSFAVEVAPFMLLKYNHLTLNDYDRHAVLYSLRLSVATQRSSRTDKTSDLAVGARLTLIDKGDLKNDRRYRAELFKLTGDVVTLKNQYQLDFLTKNNYSIQDVLQDSAKSAEMQEYIEERLQEYALAYLEGKSFDEYLQEIKNKYREENWNKQKWDIAFAVLGRSPDSLARNIKGSRVSFWTTYAQPVGNWGQLLFGGNTAYSTDSSNTMSFAFASRMYGGTNDIKVFLEAQYRYADLHRFQHLLINLGGELSLSSGLWCSFSAGVQTEKSDLLERSSHFISSFDVKFTLPEKFKLF